MLSIVASASGLARVSIEVEGESFVANMNQGGLPIRASTCFNASGGYVAEGLDIPGDWIELEITLPWTRCYADWIGCQGRLEQSNTVRLTVFEPGLPDPLHITDYVFTGEGVA
jgi:hypothetical protein